MALIDMSRSGISLYKDEGGFSAASESWKERMMKHQIARQFEAAKVAVGRKGGQGATCKMNPKIIAAGLLLACLLLPMPGFGQVVAPGYAVTNFATGFVNSGTGGIGPIGLAFDSSGNLFVGNYFTGFLYKFGPTGGVASAATRLNSVAHVGAIAGLAFTKDGRLYLARQLAGAAVNGGVGGDVVEVDPSNGAILRRVAFISHATGLAADPLSGDLFVSQACACDNAIFRISKFATGPGTVTVYTAQAADGIAFGPDGTLYSENAVIAGTNAPTPGTLITRLPNISGADGIAVSNDALRPFLYFNRQDGIITKLTPTTLTDILTGGSRGDFAAVGSDGCLYATQTDRVIKVTNADGSCQPPPLGPLFPANALVVSMDIKPQGCPNPLNVGAEGVLPVAILGTATFDVTTINLSSVKLQGVSPLRSALQDVATPFTGALVSATSCTTAGADGFTDLVLFFNNEAVSAALGTVTNGQVLVLTVAGNLLPQFGGTPITGQDVVVVIMQ
jgi:hypothetical protein